MNRLALVLSCFARVRDGINEGDIYHVKCDNIFEGDLSGFVFLNEDFVDLYRA